jgi:hypothetical protein
MDQSSRKNNAGSNQQPPARTGGADRLELEAANTPVHTFLFE